MNPVIKFTTLFGLLAVELGVQLAGQHGTRLSVVLAGGCLLASSLFVRRSFYGMRIGSRVDRPEVNVSAAGMSAR